MNTYPIKANTIKWSVQRCGRLIFEMLIIVCVRLYLEGAFRRLQQHSNVSYMPRPYLSPINTTAEIEIHTHTLSLCLHFSSPPSIRLQRNTLRNFVGTSFNLPNVKYFKFDYLLCCFNKTNDRQTNRVHLIHNILYRIIDKNFRLICSPVHCICRHPLC